MKSYKVETYETHSHSWEGIVTYKPEYIFKLAKVPRRWWFRWCKRSALVCMDPENYELKSHEQALHLAKTHFRFRPARVIEITVLNGHKTSRTLWMNGKWVHHDHMPWWEQKRESVIDLFRWLIFGSPKHEEPKEQKKD